LKGGVLTPTGKWHNTSGKDREGHLYPRSTGNPKTQISHKPNIAASINTATTISEVSEELERRRKILVKLAHRQDVPMESVERDHIIRFLELKQYPEKPTTKTRLMKEFVSSVLSINQPPHRIRNKLKSILGDIPLADTIPICLHKLYNEPGFLDEYNWMPASLAKYLADMDLDITSGSQMKTDIRHTLLASAKVMEQALGQGIEMFYCEIESAIKRGPEYTWRFMEIFTRAIPGVGPGLMSDFLKNVGFPQFVKIDQRLKKEFPQLIVGVPTDQKSMFIFAIELCQQLNMTPFLFDHILYQWGNTKFKPYLRD